MEREGAGTAELQCSVCCGTGHRKRSCAILGMFLHDKLRAKADAVDLIFRCLWRSTRDKICRDKFMRYGIMGADYGGWCGLDKLGWMDSETREKVMLTLSCDSFVWDAKFSPDGSTIVAVDGGSRTHGIKIFSAETGDLLSALNCTSVCAVDFSPDGKLIAAGFQSGNILLLDPVTCQVKLSLKPLGNLSNRAFGRGRSKKHWHVHLAFILRVLLCCMYVQDNIIP